jgi:hypothetical protein
VCERELFSFCFCFFFMCSKNIFYLKKNIVHFLVFFNNFNGLILIKKIILI